MKEQKDKTADQINKQIYQRRTVALAYRQSSLQPPEQVILIKYRDSLWNKRVLDIGCGGGRTTVVLKNVCSQYVGVDYSKEMIAACQDRFPGVAFLHCDVRNLGVFNVDSFDFVLFSFNGMDYVSHIDRLTALNEIRRVLCHGQHLVFSSHNRDYRYAKERPGMTLSRNPINLARSLLQFGVSWKNHLQNRKLQESCREYELINDSAHAYSCLTYYVSKREQVSQLQKAGFETLEMFDTSGDIVDLSDDSADSAWIYYVARKTGH